MIPDEDSINSRISKGYVLMILFIEMINHILNQYHLYEYSHILVVDLLSQIQ